HGITHIEGYLGPGLLLLHAVEDGPHLSLIQRDGPVAAAHKARDPRRVPDHIPGVVLHDHLHQHVAGEDLAGHDPLLAVPEVDLFLGGDEDPEDLVLHPHRLHPALEIGLDLVLVAGIGVDDVPGPAIIRAFGLGLTAGFV